jgi:hypothetical protein
LELHGEVFTGNFFLIAIGGLLIAIRPQWGRNSNKWEIQKMKNKILTALFLTAAILVSSTAMADPADIILGTSCGLTDENGNFNISDDTKIVITNNANGNQTLKCKFDLDPAVALAGKKAFNVKGFPCNVNGVISDGPNNTKVISASGKATLTCHSP